MKISIVGTGYVGLVSGACFAETGHNVICVDEVPEKVQMIQDGRSPIHEPGLDELLKRHIGGRLNCTGDLAHAVLHSDVTFIAVPTPFDGQEIDLTFVDMATRQIGSILRHKDAPHVVVVKSTVVPGTTDGLVRSALEQSSGKRVGEGGIGLAMNPEFLTEGQAVKDFLNPDRIVIGGTDEKSRSVVGEIYSPFTVVPVIYANNKTAEMIKYASNALLATMISFSNEIAGLCSALGGVDIVDVMDGVHRSAYLTHREDSREPITASIASFLHAGCGFGGSCLPKDVKALASQGKNSGLTMSVLNAVLDVNKGQAAKVLELIEREYHPLSGVRVALLGVAFKPDTDDTRESPSFPILKLLCEQEAEVAVYDPVATLDNDEFDSVSGITVADRLIDAIIDADVIVIATAWNEFRDLPKMLDGILKQPLVVDARRFLDKKQFKRYTGIGL